MNHVSESFDWSYMSILGAILGYLLHLMLSWKEWAKISKQTDLTFMCFLRNDLASQIIGIILVVVVYCSLTALSQLDWLQQAVGFVPKVNFFGAFMTAFTSQGVGIKLVNISRKFSSDG